MCCEGVNGGRETALDGSQLSWNEGGVEYAPLLELGAVVRSGQEALLLSRASVGGWGRDHPKLVVRDDPLD